MVPVVDKHRAMEPIEFIQLLHLTGDFYGRPFVLQPWQTEVISDVYGTLNDRGLRRYRYAYLEIPKKNGKTETTAALAIYHLACDGPGGQIYCCAAEREQASLVYKAAKQMIEQEPALDSKNGGILKVIDSKKEIYNLQTGTFLKVLSAEAYSKHGINPTVVIFDELHAQPNRDLWDVMTFGAGAARKEPLWWVITTAGDDPDRHSIGWEIHEQARKIRDGELTDPTWYVKIYGAPEDADIFDEALWYACNPSLGVSIDIEAVRQEAVSARNSEKAERLFRWLRLNQWVSLKRIGWLPITLWDQTKKEWNRADLLKKRCYVGIDLSSKIDLTAGVPLFPPQDDFEEWRFFVDGWIPEDNMKERIKRDHAPYDSFVKDKHLIATPGDVVDYAFIKNHIEKWELQYDVKYYCGDPWHLEILRQLLPREIQNKFIEIPQTMAGMTVGMGELERLFRAKQISHEHNPLGRWCFGNVVIATDGNENIKPMKNKSIDRIDTTVALINAMAGAIRFEQKRSIYETRGMRSLA
jgi:phage terminase large subunit-like protein